MGGWGVRRRRDGGEEEGRNGPDDGGDAEGDARAFEVLGKESECGVHLGPDARVDESVRQHCSRLEKKTTPSAPTPSSLPPPHHSSVHTLTCSSAASVYLSM